MHTYACIPFSVYTATPIDEKTFHSYSNVSANNNRGKNSAAVQAELAILADCL